MIIRAAVPGDATQIAAIWNAVIRDTLATFTTVEKPDADLRDMIATRAGAFWVAETEGIAGFITYGPFRAGPGYAATVEHTILLDPGAQGQGIGTQLMQTATQAAAEQGHHVMVAGISSANPGAVAFHERMGFVLTGQMPQVGRKNDQWLDLILMQKTLSPD